MPACTSRGLESGDMNHLNNYRSSLVRDQIYTGGAPHNEVNPLRHAWCLKCGSGATGLILLASNPTFTMSQMF